MSVQLGPASHNPALATSYQRDTTSKTSKTACLAYIVLKESKCMSSGWERMISAIATHTTTLPLPFDCSPSPSPTHRIPCFRIPQIRSTITCS
ncbi:hypothetical protein BD289DRAFT_445488 [Coniella lustricola]|uniref:Uncharacterized protein n=1 Tax=Coniella lustricola TaxID=2025994 RepID=A0A2T2ZUT9_9PEZI|nr:hypothetical protein BD289DRAFT_445488 [Coniella lustricola]